MKELSFYGIMMSLGLVVVILFGFKDVFSVIASIAGIALIASNARAVCLYAINNNVEE